MHVQFLIFTILLNNNSNQRKYNENIEWQFELKGEIMIRRK